jgi:stage IV sporulation protein FB
MIRIPGKIPIAISPMFWLFAGLLGYIFTQSLIGMAIWIGIIFISVLFHEFGHALTALCFGRSPRIELVAMGGLTYHDGEKLPLWKQFLIVLDGPLFGLLLFGIAWMLLQVDGLNTGVSGVILDWTANINLFWTFINLLPVLPLDGGQLMRIILEAIFGLRGLNYALLASAIAATLLSLLCFLYQSVLMGALFFLFAFQGYETWRKTRLLSEPDRSGSLKQALSDAETDLQAGRKEQALAAFESLRAQAKQGMIYVLATQYLAYLKYELGQTREAYDLLLGIRPHLSPDALSLLHRAAFDQKDYALVVDLAGNCFQNLPSAETALRTAYACAHLSQARPAVGWLQTALREGLQNIGQILADNSFDAIRSDPAFQEFLHSHS